RLTMQKSEFARGTLTEPELYAAADGGFRAVDLFCGAGGLSLGLREAGFEIVLSVDHDEAAFETYKRNIGDHAKRAEINENLRIPKTDVIAGGPPCQGFSSAGPRRIGDLRNS